MRNYRVLLILALAVLALILRMRNLDFTLPYFTSDGGYIVPAALNILKNHSLDPGIYKYGAFTFYILAFIYLVYFFLLSLWDPTLGGMGTLIAGFAIEDRGFILFYLARYSCLAFGLISILLVWIVARRLFGKEVAYLSSFIIAINPYHIFFSQIINPDIICLVLILAVIFFSLGIMETEKVRNYLAAAVASGMMIASRYNVLVVVIPFLAHFSRLKLRNNMDSPESLPEKMKIGVKAVFDERLILLGFLVGLSAFLLTPYTVLNFNQAVPHFSRIFSSHLGIIVHNPTGLIYTRFLYELLMIFPPVFGPPVYLASWPGIYYLIRKKSFPARFIFSYPILYILIIGLITITPYPQYWLTIFPFFLFLAAFFLWEFFISGRLWKKTVAGLLLFLTVGFSLSDLYVSHFRPLFDLHKNLGIWIESNLAPGQKIVLSRWYFPPTNSFRKDRIINLYPFDLLGEDFLVLFNPEYLQVMESRNPLLSDNEVQFDLEHYQAALHDLADGKYRYQPAARISPPLLWQSWGRRIYPSIGEAEFVIYKRGVPYSLKEKREYLRSLFAESRDQRTIERAGKILNRLPDDLEREELISLFRKLN